MKTRRVLVAIPIAAAVLVGGVYLFGPVLGAFNRLTRMPSVVSAPHVERLTDSPVAARAQRKRFVEAWRNGRDYGLRRTQLTIEATPVELWLVTSGGTLTLVADYSRDAYSNRSVYVGHPDSVELGPEKEVEADPLRAWFPGSDQEYLRCRLSKEAVEFF